MSVAKLEVVSQEIEDNALVESAAVYEGPPPVRINPKTGMIREGDLARYASFYRRQALFEVARIVGASPPLPEPEEPPGAPVQRYRMDVWPPAASNEPVALPREDNYGEWVKWKDVKKLLKKRKVEE